MQHMKHYAGTSQFYNRVENYYYAKAWVRIIIINVCLVVGTNEC